MGCRSQFGLDCVFQPLCEAKRKRPPSVKYVCSCVVNHFGDGSCLIVLL